MFCWKDLLYVLGVSDYRFRNAGEIPQSPHSAVTIYVLTVATVLTACNLIES